MSNLREVKEIFDRIASISAKSSKEAILKQNKDNELFKECLKFLLDDSIVTGLSTKKMNKNVLLCDDTWGDIRDAFNYLKIHNTGTDVDISIIKTFCVAQGECKEFCEGLFTKKLKIGCDTKTVNKVYPGFILTHDVMLASKYEGKLKEDVSMSLKLDGIRMSLVTINGETKALSRQGKEITGIDYIIKEYKELGLNNYFVDGEIIRINYNQLPSDENFRLTTQIVNSKSENKQGLEFIVFDMTPIEDYINHFSKLNYGERLVMMMNTIGDKGKYISLVKKYGITNNVEEINEMLDRVVSRGCEGLMLNNINGTYEFGKRPKSIMKVKKFSEADVYCYDIFEGEGRLKGTLGGIKCKFIYKNQVCEVEVGSGFSDTQRKLIFENSELIKNKVVAIKFFEVSKNATTNNYSLRFPTFIDMEHIRVDKSTLEDTNID